MVEEWVDHNDTNPYVGGGGVNTAPDGSVNRRARQFWGIRYIDDAVARFIDRDADDSWADDTGLYFYLTDALFSVRGLWDQTGGHIEEWIDYDAYGEPHRRSVLDFDHDGTANLADVQAIIGVYGVDPVGNNTVDTDVDADGDFDGDDLVLVAGGIGTRNAPSGWLSQPRDGGGDGSDNALGMAGYRHDAEAGQYAVRFRRLDTSDGRWMTRDPAGYVDGSSLYSYTSGRPLIGVDPTGLKLMIKGRKGMSGFGRHVVVALQRLIGDCGRVLLKDIVTAPDPERPRKPGHILYDRSRAYIKSARVEIDMSDPGPNCDRFRQCLDELSKILASPEVYTIHATTGSNGAIVRGKNDVYWNPGQNLGVWTDPNGGDLVWHKPDPAVVLWHELMHTLHDLYDYEDDNTGKSPWGAGYVNPLLVLENIARSCLGCDPRYTGVRSYLIDSDAHRQDPPPQEGDTRPRPVAR